MGPKQPGPTVLDLAWKPTNQPIGNVGLIKYWVILKKVSFGIFTSFLVSKEEKNFTIKSKDKGLLLSKFSWYLVIVKIIRIRHSKGHISQTNHDLKNVFMQK